MSKGRKEGVTTKEITVLRFHGEMNASCEPGPRNGDGKGETRRLNLSSRGDPTCRQSRKPISVPLIFCSHASGSIYP